MDLSKKYTDLLIMGDFNIHYYHDYDIISEQFQDLVEAVGLIQHVNFVTHTSGNIIDLVSTKVTKVREGPMLSDHKMVIWNLNIDKPDTQSIWKEFHNWKKVDLDDLCNILELDTLNYDVENLSDFLRKYENKITSKLGENVPLIKKSGLERF